jgi:hypothetical protein
VLAVALERPVQEQPSVVSKRASRTCEQTLGNAPRRDVDHVGAEHRQQFAGTAAVLHWGIPGRIGQIDPQRRADIR